MYRTQRVEGSRPATKSRRNEDVNVCMMWCIICMCAFVVYYNDPVHCTLVRNIWREKTLGEMWAAVIKTINNLLRTSVASNAGSPKWGQSRSQYMPRRGPWRTYSRGASRRPKPKYVHYSIHVQHRKEMFQTLLQVYLLEDQHSRCTLSDVCTCTFSLPIIVISFSRTSCVCILAGVYFSRVKNKPWISWVYTWSWHCHQQ